MAKEFSAVVHNFIRRNDALMTMVVQESIQRTVDMAQVTKAKGGKLPVVTGFLRASGRLSFTGMPTGPTRGEKDREYSSPDKVSLAGFKMGRTIFWGWTAAYARKQNLYNGFLDDAVAKWQSTVDGVVRDLRGRFR